MYTSHTTTSGRSCSIRSMASAPEAAESTSIGFPSSAAPTSAFTPAPSSTTKTFGILSPVRAASRRGALQWPRSRLALVYSHRDAQQQLLDAAGNGSRPLRDLGALHAIELEPGLPLALGERDDARESLFPGAASERRMHHPAAL